MKTKCKRVSGIDNLFDLDTTTNSKEINKLMRSGDASISEHTSDYGSSIHSTETTLRRKILISCVTTRLIVSMMSLVAENL
jgi:hypothetical protein